MGFFDKFKGVVGVLVEGKPPETEEVNEEEKVNEEGREQESKKEGKDEEQEGYEEIKGKTNNDEEKDKERVGKNIEKSTGLKNEVGYRPSYDGKDRERVVRMVKLLKESGLKVKVANNDKYGDYFMIPLGKEVNIISTPTLVIESTSNQVLYNKHSEGSNLENSLGKVIKDRGDKELYNNAKDFIDIYNKSNDLRRTLN